MNKTIDIHEICKLIEINFLFVFFFRNKDKVETKLSTSGNKIDFQIMDEIDEEIEMMLAEKSRFSRYRARVQERINININESEPMDADIDVRS